MKNSPTIIVACTRDFAIGNHGDLLFHIREDLKHFKSLTMGCPIIMGRRTFESFPKGALPGRRNMVITRNPDYSAPGIETYPSLESALKAATETNVLKATLTDTTTSVPYSQTQATTSAPQSISQTSGTETTPYIIGGGEIYAQALPLVSDIELTLIDTVVPEADTHFPAIDGNEWLLLDSTPFRPDQISFDQTDPATGIRFTYLHLHRK